MIRARVKFWVDFMTRVRVRVKFSFEFRVCVLIMFRLGVSF